MKSPALHPIRDLSKQDACGLKQQTHWLPGQSPCSSVATGGRAQGQRQPLAVPALSLEQECGGTGLPCLGRRVQVTFFLFLFVVCLGWVGACSESLLASFLCISCKDFLFQYAFLNINSWQVS